MTSIIHARDDDAVRNGSFIHQRIGKRSSTFAQYMNGDFITWLQQLPPQKFRIYSRKDAKRLMPKSMGGAR